jgi:D-3-phosphoglycerate dehydrogenase
MNKSGDVAQLRVVAIDDGYESYDQEIKLLAEIGATFEVIPCMGESHRVIESVKDADVILVRESPINSTVIDSLVHTKAIIRYGIGVDNIDMEAAKRRSIYVANVPDYGIDEVSTHAVMLALSAMRNVIFHDRLVRSGKWTSGITAPMYRWHGKTLGLIGYGRIAQMTHQKLSVYGFGRVLVHDPFSELPSTVESASIDQICAESDLLSLHAPLTEQTRHLINARNLSLMKPTSVLVNTARGGLVDIEALTHALKNKLILAAGLDVFEHEPPDSTHELFSLDNVIVTNHISWYSEESMRELQYKTAQEAVRVLTGAQPVNWLNKW